MTKPTHIALLALAALAVGSVGIAQSDDGLDLNSLDQRIEQVVDASNAQADTLDQLTEVVNTHSGIMDCLTMEPVRYRSVTLADGTVARTLVPVKATYPADAGVHFVIHVKRNCKALAS